MIETAILFFGALAIGLSMYALAEAMRVWLHS